MGRRIAQSVVIGLAVVLSACGRIVGGNPVPLEPNLATIWDPCTAIPDAALRATDLDPGTKSAGLVAVKFDGWKACGWAGTGTADWHLFAAYSSLNTTDQLKKDIRFDRFQNFSAVNIGSRWASQFKNYAAYGSQCYLAFPTAFGLVMLSIEVKKGKMYGGNLCEVLIQHTERLLEYLPARR